MVTPGPLGLMIEDLGVKVDSLGMNVGQKPSLQDLIMLRQKTVQRQPDVVQGWMYHGNLASLAAARPRWRSFPVIWGVHHTITKLENEKPMTRAIIKVSARLSRFTDAIIYCSRQSAKDHESLGFAKDKSIVIPNGVDCELYHPKPESRARLRNQLGIPEARRLVGFVARFHPMKDHRNLIAAAKHLLDRSYDVHVVFVGTGTPDQEAGLKAYVAECGVGDRITFMGLRHDIPDIVPGFDVFCLPSAWGEAFPLVVCEAMASGVPCVVTDVGDAAWIVGDTGTVVDRQDSDMLAAALRNMLDLGDEALRVRGKAARERILSEFPLSKMAASYRDVARSVKSARARVAA